MAVRHKMKPRQHLSLSSSLPGLNKGSIYVVAASPEIQATCDRQSLGRCVETPTEKEQGAHLGLIRSINLDL